MISVRISISRSEIDKLVRKVESSSSYPTLITTLKEALKEEPRRRKPDSNITGPGTDYCNSKAAEDAKAITKELRSASSADNIVKALREGLKRAEVNEAVHKLEC